MTSVQFGMNQIYQTQLAVGPQPKMVNPNVMAGEGKHKKHIMMGAGKRKMGEGKRKHRRKRGGNAGAIAGAVTGVAALGSDITKAGVNANEKSGQYDRDKTRKQLDLYSDLKYKRDSALLTRNKLDKKLTNAQLAAIAGLPPGIY